MELAKSLDFQGKDASGTISPSHTKGGTLQSPLYLHSKKGRLITQVASSNLASATNKIKHLLVIKALGNEGLFVCDDVCDEVCVVTQSPNGCCDRWAIC
jgi:hypothetical protein